MNGNGSITVNITLTVGEVVLLDKLAKSNRRSRNKQVEQLLSEALARVAQSDARAVSQ